MTSTTRHGILALLAIAALAAGCDSKPPPPPPPLAPAKVEAPPPSADEVTKRLAAEAYVYGYPLVLMDATRQIDTAKTPVNTFRHERAPAGTVTPNGDVLFSRAWLDLSAEPVVLSLPDARDRYYVLPMLGGWTDVFSSPGKRQTGTEKRDFAIVGPSYKKPLPADLTAIAAPTDMVWIVGRVDPGGPGGAAAAAKLQEQLKLTPLSQWGKKPARAAAAAAPAKADAGASAAQQVAQLDAKAFFTRLAALLATNPPSKEDGAMVQKLGKLGIVPGQPFDFSKLDAPTAAATEAGVVSARDAIASSAKTYIGDLRNGWAVEWDTGRYGANYGLRAVMAALRLGANAPEDAIFASARVDGDGKPLVGTSRYVLHFDKGQAPPSEAFWAVSLYDDAKRFVANPLDRHALGDNDKLATNPDGSIDLYLQNANPGPDKASNWLPAPPGPFNVMLRVYWPKQAMLERKWTPPPIREVK